MNGFMRSSRVDMEIDLITPINLNNPILIAGKAKVNKNSRAKKENLDSTLIGYSAGGNA